MKKAGESKMFDRIRRSDEASASSAQGIQRHGAEGSLRQDSSSSSQARGQEHAWPGVSTVQNRQGYCNCCHVHYSNLEQHVFSSQHRHFTTYCRNRTGTSSLMERFLQDVLQHHPHRYHDNSQHLEKGKRGKKEVVDNAVEVLELQKVQSQSNVKQTQL
ncbi:DBF4-type zinc finger-containing protein 2 isoform X5 [Manacus candei]|uniref:DBF4-type zinc finger-containing protein 2 isoform X5 n=1 Tax=Manacus candei TaxID=415023 RepID=UPI002227931A|nr:DBF4-type zinc finger-containing protein 2 isoform X5 [Manacus candei]